VTWVMWNLLSVRLEIVLASVQDTSTVWAKHTTGKSFWTHMMELQGDVCQVKSRFGPFGDSVSVGAR
jgi:hypothetical protein